ncbi:MAG TPA: sigma-70 family RNA polymerase sigma factor [Chthoniobacterales bacterium]|nr:sigma-70 family RNA polymerase sigma factor [Chthoniobacterales bacterium]
MLDPPLQNAAASVAMSVAPDHREAFIRLLDQHIGIIRKVAAAYTGSRADRLDLMQEISLQLWKAYPRYSPERPFSTWMYRIALNVAISFLRSTTRPHRQTVSLETTDPEIPDQAAPQADERVTELQRVIEGLEPLNRALLLLYLDEHSYREIAAILGITETNVATKISRLKERVRQRMAQTTERQ